MEVFELPKFDFSSDRTLVGHCIENYTQNMKKNLIVIGSFVSNNHSSKFEKFCFAKNEFKNQLMEQLNLTLEGFHVPLKSRLLKMIYKIKYYDDDRKENL